MGEIIKFVCLLTLFISLFLVVADISGKQFLYILLNFQVYLILQTNSPHLVIFILQKCGGQSAGMIMTVLDFCVNLLYFQNVFLLNVSVVKDCYYYNLKE
jgi:hypothetical protein